ncbi:MarR family transcriptional regulator [Methanolobus sp.]|uniref:MarR family transcriptional regulator n=1 Tax=Methanolobus sp. TaxID=1874737 RepID=UPI0025E7443A|nr:MarR family transcriptional regulator [Methanolobus sp.]
MIKPEVIGKKIGFIASHNHLYIERVLEPYNLKGPMFAFLLTLSRWDGCSQESLARHLNLSKATATRAIRDLEGEGYVSRTRDRDDRRIYRVFISDRGKQLIPVVHKTLTQWNGILLSDFSEDEKEIFARLLGKGLGTLQEFDKRSDAKLTEDYQI